MARKGPNLMAAGVLLVLCLLGGAASPEKAGPASGLQLVLVLDISEAPSAAEAKSLLSQGAGLLVHLLGEEDSLGLVGTGDGGRILLPLGGLTRNQRQSALKELARLTPARDPAAFPKALALGLQALASGGSKSRALLVITDSGAGLTSPPEESKTSGSPAQPEITGQIRRSGAVLYAAAPDLKSLPTFLGALTAETGGRVFELSGATDLAPVGLRLYEQLKQPQQAPLSSGRFHIDPRVRELVVAAPRSAGGKAVALTDPTGARINPGPAAKNLRWHSVLAWDLVVISRPRAGWWLLAQSKEGEGRVFLDTDLRLLAPSTPREVGADEALAAAAVLRDRGEPLPSVSLEGVRFTGVIEAKGLAPVEVELRPLPGPGPTPWPADTRLGFLPPGRREGEATLRLRALGKTFQRELSLPLTQGPPWYRVGPGAPGCLRFLPIPGRCLEHVWGVASLHSPGGTLTGIFFKADPRAEIVVTAPLHRPGPYEVELFLSGRDPEGRPRVIRTAVSRLEAPPGGPPPGAGNSRAGQGKGWLSALALSGKASRRWLWLGLGLLGVGIFGVAAFLLYRQRSPRASAEDEGGEAGQGGNSRKNYLLLKSQVEMLQKDKTQLKSDWEDLNRQLEQVKAEKADLTAELERQAQKNKVGLRSLGDLEKKLEEAEQEARSVQEEYTALYARTQGDKGTLQKE